jgi:hypothetical protein
LDVVKPVTPTDVVKPVTPRFVPPAERPGKPNVELLLHTPGDAPAVVGRLSPAASSPDLERRLEALEKKLNDLIKHFEGAKKP